jgi:8-oxo-dGTP pyrophosphatase MutT (NUDIX family)
MSMVDQAGQSSGRLAPPISNAARALIVREDNILLLRKAGYAAGERYVLPGGKQDPGETLEQALQRECLEEIGTRVGIGRLVYVADYFKPREIRPPATRQLVDFLFECHVPDDYVPGNGPRPDRHQIEVVWAALNELAGLPLYPRTLAPHLENLRANAGVAYLGLIHW